MPRRTQVAHGYKDVSLPQLRSFVETARLGSLSAAADALGLTHPTVWMQVHALERVLGHKLVEPAGRGVRPTAAGKRLAELAAGLVRDAGTLKARFTDAVAAVRPGLTVATTPRVLAEDLPPVIRAFAAARPDVDLTLTEVGHPEAAARLQDGLADLAILADAPGLTAGPAADWLEFRPAYHITCYLIAPKRHPLARKKQVELADLAGYPVVSGPLGFPDPVMAARLERLGVFAVRPLRVEAQFTATSRRYVKLGFGVAIVSRHPSVPADPDLHERDLTRHFGRVAVGVVGRRGEPTRDAAAAFEATVRAVLGPTPAARRPSSRL